MAYLTVDNVKISAIAACVPKNKESNHDYGWITEQERQLLIKTTGIENRHIAPKHVTTSDMCYASAEAIITKSEIDRNEIEVLLFVSQSPDYFLPATSIILQDRLGLGKSTMAFDIQLGCSGYVYGLSVISNLMSCGKFKKGLLLVGDKSSFSPSRKDKSTYPIFGDAGTATLLEYDISAGKMDFNLQSDGSGYKAIMIEDGGMRNAYSDQSDEMIEIAPGIIRNRKNLMLDGIEVFNFSLREAAPNVADLLAYNSTETKDYDFFVFHQANKLMNESIRKKIKLEPEKVPYSLKEYGNTSSASIPLTIVTELAGQLKDNRVAMVFSAFGVGLSWASAAVTVNNLHCLPLIEIE